MKQNESISNKHKRICKIRSYVKHLLILTSTATVYVRISDFALEVGIPVRFPSSAAKAKICVITAGIKTI